MENAVNETPRLLRDKQVAVILSVSRCFVWTLAKRGIIPKPIKLSEKHTVWKSEDIFKVAANPEQFVNQARANGRTN